MLPAMLAFGYLGVALVAVAAGPPAADPPLHRLAWQGEVSGVERELSGGADVNALGARDLTALHWAVMGDRGEAALVLLDRGADPNARGQYDMTPLHWAAMLGRAALVPALVARGAKVGAKNLYGLTPLHEAADERTVAALVEAGAPVEVADDDGLTPLFLARTKEVGQALLSRRADVNARSRDGRTLFDMLVVNTLADRGLVLYGRRNGARLRGTQSRFDLQVRNISAEAVERVELCAKTEVATVDCPAEVARLNPGQRATFTFVLHRKGEVPEGLWPVAARVLLGGKEVGVFELESDNHRGETPQDRGMVRLNQVTLKPGASRWFSLAFLVVPLVVLAAWWALRRRAQ